MTNSRRENGVTMAIKNIVKQIKYTFEGENKIMKRFKKILQTTPPATFSTVTTGQSFCWNGSVYERLDSNVERNYGLKANAVRLTESTPETSKRFRTFAPTEVVTMVNEYVLAHISRVTAGSNS